MVFNHVYMSLLFIQTSCACSWVLSVNLSVWIDILPWPYYVGDKLVGRYPSSWDVYYFLCTTRSMSVSFILNVIPLHDMRLIMNVCSLVCNSWVCQYPYAALMIIGYMKIVTLGCNFMLLIVGCRTMVPCVLLMS